MVDGTGAFAFKNAGTVDYQQGLDLQADKMSEKASIKSLGLVSK